MTVIVPVDMGRVISAEYSAGDPALLFAQASAEHQAEKLTVAIASSKWLVRHGRMSA
jgi:hypothetical protein